VHSPIGLVNLLGLHWRNTVPSSQILKIHNMYTVSRGCCCSMLHFGAAPRGKYPYTLWFLFGASPDPKTGPALLTLVPRDEAGTEGYIGPEKTGIFRLGSRLIHSLIPPSQTQPHINRHNRAARGSLLRQRNETGSYVGSHERRTLIVNHVVRAQPAQVPARGDERSGTDTHDRSDDPRVSCGSTRQESAKTPTAAAATAAAGEGRVPVVSPCEIAHSLPTTTAAATTCAPRFKIPVCARPIQHASERGHAGAPAGAPAKRRQR
jgi:hypothetical protein